MGRELDLVLDAVISALGYRQGFEQEVFRKADERIKQRGRKRA